jgi:uncharacterized alkaline shock family protein YloU
MSDVVINNTDKKVNISKEVIRKICEAALIETGEMSVKYVKKIGFTDIFGQKADSFSDVNFNDDSAEISLSVTVSPTCKAYDVSESIQKRIIDDVRSMTGITVSRVNVVISGITPDKKEKKCPPQK